MRVTGVTVYFSFVEICITTNCFDNNQPSELEEKFIPCSIYNFIFFKRLRVRG